MTQIIIYHDTHIYIYLGMACRLRKQSFIFTRDQRPNPETGQAGKEKLKGYEYKIRDTESKSGRAGSKQGQSDQDKYETNEEK